MIHLLPTELLWNILNQLEYQDLDRLLKVKRLESTVHYYIQIHYKFHYQIASLLRLYEAITPTERQQLETKQQVANKILQFICKQVEPLPKFEHRTKFSELLDIVQQLTLQRILATDFKSNGLEHDYAGLCLKIRDLYLHTPAIRVLHDPVSSHYLPFFLYKKTKIIFRNIVEEVQSIPWHHFYPEIILIFGDIIVQSKIRSIERYVRDLRISLEDYLK